MSGCVPSHPLAGWRVLDSQVVHEKCIKDPRVSGSMAYWALDVRQAGLRRALLLICCQAGGELLLSGSGF